MNTRIFASLDAAAEVLRSRGGPEGLAALSILQKLREEAAIASESFQLGAPMVFVEGPDGVGKTTLLRNLAALWEKEHGEPVALLTSPPQELSHLRSHFDAIPEKELRRAFYLVGNYALAYRASMLAPSSLVLVDRFWASTVSYAMAHDLNMSPKDAPSILLCMPRDLLELLPGNRAVIFLLFNLAEDVRAARVRSRCSSAGFQGSLALTAEEVELERSSEHRQRLQKAFEAVSIGGDKLIACDASGSEHDVLERVVKVVQDKDQERIRLTPLSVNWHYTRQCNYACKFCFHTATSDYFLPREEQGMAEAKRCLRLLRNHGMKKINFSGGEPFLWQKQLGELCRFCKQELKLESVSIVSNGSKVKERWIKQFGRHIDILAISCDSFDEETNKRIGRGTGMHLTQLRKVKDWCKANDVLFKLNTVVNAYNIDEDMSAAIAKLEPVRWKVFQVLLLKGENKGEHALRDAQQVAVSDHMFAKFIERHSKISCLVPEDNQKMKDSYLILDERLRFLNCMQGSKTPSRSIRDVSVACALREAGFDREMFEKRGGVYNWSKNMPKQKQPEDKLWWTEIDRQRAVVALPLIAAVLTGLVLVGGNVFSRRSSNR